MQSLVWKIKLAVKIFIVLKNTELCIKSARTFVRKKPDRLKSNYENTQIIHSTLTVKKIKSRLFYFSVYYQKWGKTC